MIKENSAEYFAMIYILRNGRCKDWSMYSEYSGNEKETIEALEDIFENEIDLKLSKAPTDQHHQQFNGTFCDPVYVDCFEQTIVTNSNNTYKFGCKFETPKNVFKLVSSMMNNDGNLLLAVRHNIIDLQKILGDRI